MWDNLFYFTACKTQEALEAKQNTKSMIWDLFGFTLLTIIHWVLLKSYLATGLYDK